MSMNVRRKGERERETSNRSHCSAGRGGGDIEWISKLRGDRRGGGDNSK